MYAVFRQNIILSSFDTINVGKFQLNSVSICWENSKKTVLFKTLDTIGNCQRPVFPLAVSQHTHKITNLWKSSKVTLGDISRFKFVDIFVYISNHFRWNDYAGFTMHYNLYRLNQFTMFLQGHKGLYRPSSTNGNVKGRFVLTLHLLSSCWENDWLISPSFQAVKIDQNKKFFDFFYHI